MANELGKSRWSRRRSEPKSVLGFFAIVLGILFSAVVGTVGVLAWTGQPTELVVSVLAFGGGFLLLVVGGVFVVMLRDPSKLMLTHVTGDEFLAIQTHHTLGDSINGLSPHSAITSSAPPIELVALSIVDVGSESDQTPHPLPELDAIEEVEKSDER